MSLEQSQDADSVQVKNRHYDNLAGVICGTLAAAGLTFLPLAFRDASNSDKSISITWGLIIAAATAGYSEYAKRTEKIYSVHEKANAKLLATHLGMRLNLAERLAKVEHLEQQSFVVENLPAYKHQRYVAELQLEGLVLSTNQDPNVPQLPQSPGRTLQVQQALPVFRGDVANLIDTSWMGHDLWFSSGAVIGDEGSGKSAFLAMWALNILAICPDVDLKIHTIHHDSDEEPWFPNMPKDVEDSFFIRDPDEMYADMENVLAELSRREKTKDRQSAPIVRITDEFQSLGTSDMLGEQRLKKYIEAMIQIKNRGRKYARKINGKDTGVRLIAGLHSIKKGMTGLDASFLNKTVVCLGSALKDPTAMYPADFIVKDLIAGQEILKSQLISAKLMNPADKTKDSARPAVIRIDGGSPMVVALPKPDLRAIQYEVVEADRVTLTPDQEVPLPNPDRPEWLEGLVGFARMNRRLPTNEEVFRYMLEKTGKSTPDELVGKIIAMIDRVLKGES
ncbi:MAG: hypothetical protein ACRDBG_06155 [Waterburya sp.]